LKSKADPNITGTFIPHALSNATPENVKLLLLAKADPNKENVSGQTAISMIQSEESCKLLLDAGTIVNRPGLLTLHNSYCSPECYSLLIKAKADPNETNKYGQTPLIIQSGWLGLQKIHMLLQAGANINHQDCDGETALFTRSASIIVERLLELGADPNIRNHKGRTAIMTSPFTETLLFGKADPNVKDNEGKTALHLNKRPESIRTLMGFINVFERDVYGATALTYSQNPVTINLLKRKQNSLI
jgi:ankyrin repeat protein